jgi:hypothetical protein
MKPTAVYQSGVNLLFDLASEISANCTILCLGVWLHTQSSSFFSATDTADVFLQVKIQEQGCQIAHFQTKNSNLGTFWRVL